MMKRLNSSENRMNRTPEIPEFTDRAEMAQKKRVHKYLFKFRISDILQLAYDQEEECYKYKDNMEVDKVICGGRISDIFRDDSLIFSFEMNDGTGSIQCLYKIKGDREPLITAFTNKYKDMTYFTNKIMSDDSTIYEDKDATTFQIAIDSSVVKNLEKEAEESRCKLMDWYVKEILNGEKVRQINDIIHMVGFLMETGNVRKINVLEFQIIEDEIMHKKFLEEIEWQRKTYV